MFRTAGAGKAAIPYELVQTARKDVAFRVLPGGQVRVYAPRGLSLRRADELVLANRAQIEQAGVNMRRYEAQQDSQFPMRSGMTFPLEGRAAVLHVAQSAKPSVEFADGEVRLRLPDTAPEQVREALRNALIERFRVRLKERLAYYIPLIGRQPGRVTIREQKTRWGSCSSQHNLNFNWLLIMAPPEALDYVVIHELCHLYEFNHSPAFWARVERYQPEYARWRQWLRSGWNHPFR